MDKLEYRAVIKFLVKEGKSTKEINERFRTVYGEYAPNYQTVRAWVKQFEKGKESLNDQKHTGRRMKATSDDVVAKIQEIISNDPRIGKKAIAPLLGISMGSVFNVLHNRLYLHKVYDRWVPQILVFENKRERLVTARAFLERIKSDENGNETDIFHRIVAVAEVWLRQNSESKILAVIVWDAKGILMINTLPKNTPMTDKMYAEQMYQLYSTIKMKRSNLIDQGVLLLHDNIAAHKSACVVDAINDCGFAELPHPINSPDLSPSDYFLFESTKQNFERKWRQPENKILSALWQLWDGRCENWFFKGISELKLRYEKCIEAEGGYISV